MKTERKTFNKKHGTTGDSGHLYEIKLVLLILLRAVRRTQLTSINSFYLGSNLEEGYCFDDVVFAYRYTNTNGEEKSSIIFIQTKHKEKSKRQEGEKGEETNKTRVNYKKNETEDKKNISIDTLLSPSISGDFILRKYLCSFIKIRQLFSQNLNHPIFNGNLDDCEFIIYTNAAFNYEKYKKYIGVKSMKDNHFLNITKNKTYYTLLDTHEKIKNALKINLDYQKLTKALAQCIASKSIDMNNSIIKDYHYYLDKEVFTRINEEEGVISETFFNEELSELRNGTFLELKRYGPYSYLSYNHLKEYLQTFRIALPDKFGVCTEYDLKLPLPRKYTDDEDIKQFLSKFKLFTDQPNETDLTNIIKSTLRSNYSLEETDINNFYITAEYEMHRWWKKENYYLTENDTFIQDIAKVSFYFEVKLPTNLFTGRKRELRDLHASIQRSKNKLNGISQITIISGLGGVGKTELARQYIEEYSEYYDNNIIWIDAENDAKLFESFVTLAEDNLRLLTKTADGRRKKIQSIAKEVYRHFSIRKSLFVYDNVENCKDFITILQLHKLKTERNHPHVLITSRKREWEIGIEVIDLSVLAVNEAMELVKKGLSIQDDIEDNNIKELVNKLQCFPLAIRQAIKYINDECLTAYTISDYLREFKNNATDILNFKLVEGIDNDYTKTTYTTWNTTLDKISQKANGETALQLLNIMAFIANKNINKDMFLHSSYVKEAKQLKSSIILLLHYSMITTMLQKSGLSINRLVQKVTRLKLTDQNQDVEFINESCLVLEKYFPYDSFNIADLDRKRQLLPHIEKLVYRIDNHLYNNRQKLDIVCLTNLLNLLSDGYSSCDPKNRKKILERILKINEAKYGKHTSQTFQTILRLSDTNRLLGDYQREKELLEEALELCERIRDLGHHETAMVLSNLAMVHGNLQNPEKQREFLERALEIQNHITDHKRISLILRNLALYHGTTGNANKEKELLDAALTIQEDHFGPDHYEVAETLLRLSGALDDPTQQIDLVKRAFAIGQGYHAKDNLADFRGHIKILEQVLDIYEKKYGSGHVDLVIVLKPLSRAYALLGEYQKQHHSLEYILHILENRYGPNDIELSEILISLGDLHEKLGNFQQQKHSLERLLEIQEKHYKAGDFRVSKTQKKLVVCEKLGQLCKEYEL